MNILEFLKVKHIIETHNPKYGFKWRIERRVIEESNDKYCISIDDGHHSYYKIFLNKYDYEIDELVYICNELAELLGIECIVHR